MEFSDNQIERYSRNILLDEVGPEGQEKLLESRVLFIGAGGLGSPAALYLAAAGVGTIGIADGDEVDLSNLQRQILHFTNDIGRKKVESASEKITSLNSDVKVNKYPYIINAENILDVIENYDFIIDGTDNFPSKFLINDACVKMEKPFSHGGILRFHGQSMTYQIDHACLRCIFPEIPDSGSAPSCSEAGILGVVAGILGSLQAGEALKYILSLKGLLVNSLFHFDISTMNFGTIKIKPNVNCSACSKKNRNKPLEMDDFACKV